METDEGHLINENSNGLSHLLTEGEFNSVDAVGVDESSASNQGFLNAVELSTGSVSDYLDNNSGFNEHSFDVGDNAVTFPNENLNNVLSDGDSHDIMSSVFKSTHTTGESTDVESKTNDEAIMNEALSPPDVTNDDSSEKDKVNNDPTSENVESKSESIPGDITESMPESILLSDDIPQNISEDIPQNISEDVSQDISEDTPQNVSESIPKEIKDDNHNMDKVTNNISAEVCTVNFSRKHSLKLP